MFPSSSKDEQHDAELILDMVLNCSKKIPPQNQNIFALSSETLNLEKSNLTWLFNKIIIYTLECKAFIVNVNYISIRALYFGMTKP